MGADFIWAIVLKPLRLMAGHAPRRRLEPRISSATHIISCLCVTVPHDCFLTSTVPVLAWPMTLEIFRVPRSVATFFSFPAAGRMLVAGVVWLILLAAGFWQGSALGQSLSQYLVTSAADHGAGTLRDGIAQVISGGQITFSNSLSGQVILLTSGELLLNKSVTISASTLASAVTVDGQHSSRMFEVANGATVVLEGLVLTNGYASAGGAILNGGNLTLNRCTVTGCAVSGGGGGGGIYNNLGSASLNECTITGNSATAGGGLFNLSGGIPMTLKQCTVTGNSATSGGGFDGFNLGPANVSLLDIFNTILAGNNAGAGADVTGVSVSQSGVNLVGGIPMVATLGNYGGPIPTMPPLPGSPAINAGDNSATNYFLTDQRGFPRFSGAHVDIGAVELQAPLVTTIADSGPGSLRWVAALPVEPGGTIAFAPALSGQTIQLISGEIALSGNFVVDASSLPAGLTVNAGNLSRVFNVLAGAQVTIQGLTITQGYAPDAGGAIYTAAGSALHLVACTVTGSSGLEGGALLNDGTLLAENCTFTGNNASYGGALQCRAPSTLTHCTIAGNTATWGGGIYNKWSTLTLNNSIIAGNTAGSGLDIYSQLAALVFANHNIVEDVIRDRPSAPDIGSSLAADPLLAPLGNYGGPTPTMQPLANSPAIDAGGPTSLATDQRGFPRVIGPAPDLGAAEFCLKDPVVTTNIDFGPGSLRYAVTYSQPGTTISFATNLSGSTIEITRGNFSFNRDLTIDASALPQRVRLHGYEVQLFTVAADVSVVMNSLDWSGGVVVGSDGSAGVGNPAYLVGGQGGAGADARGGAIYNAGKLAMSLCSVSGGSVAGGSGGNGGTAANGGMGGAGGSGLGGAIYNAGDLSLSRCEVTGSTASGGTPGFGGIGSTNGGSAGASGLARGGGVYNQGTAVISQSTFNGNTAVGGTALLGTYGAQSRGGSSPGGTAQGGDIYNAGTLLIDESTIIGGSAIGGPGGGDPSIPLFVTGGNAFGGGICNAGTLTIRQSTLVGNSGIHGVTKNLGVVILNGTSRGGGVFSENSFTLHNSILTGNTADLGANVLGQFGSTTTNLLSVDPVLASPGYYGGPTMVLPPLAGSPAIDAGSNSIGGLFATDQRGRPRVSGAKVDLGAVEYQVAGSPFWVSSATPASGSGGQFSFTNLPWGNFTVLGSTNPASLLSTWSILGPAVENPPGSGKFQFSDPQASLYRQRFYRVRSP